MNPRNAHHAAEFRTNMGGRFRCFVVDAKTKRVLKSTPWQSNLILDSGLDRLATEQIGAQMLYAVAGTGNTPTKDLADGTYSQAGTTVTRVTGTRDFTSGDVGKLIKWTTGEEAKITAFTNATTVTVNKTQTVAAAAIVCLYRVNQTGLVAEVKRTNTYPEFTDPDDGLTARAVTVDKPTTTIKFKNHYDFTAEVANVNYTEVGVSSQSGAGANIFSRMLLAGAVSVEEGQQLRLKYELTVKIYGGLVSEQPTLTGGITGWPRPYNVSGIVSTGSNFTVTLTENHHYLAGGKFNLVGVKKPRTAITASSSNPTTITHTAVGHGKSPGDTIIVEGMTPSAYNGEFLVDTTPDADTLTIASVLNPGTGTAFGNLRLKEPATWYDSQEWTIASVGANTVVITSALNLGTVNANEGTAKNNDKRKLIVNSYSVGPFNTSQSGNQYGQVDGILRYMLGTTIPYGQTWLNAVGVLDTGSNAISLVIPATPPTSYPNTFPVNWAGNTQRDDTGASTTIGSNGAGNSSQQDKAGTNLTYVNGTFYRDSTHTWAAGDGNFQNIVYIGISVSLNSRNMMAHIKFEEPQRKDNTHKLTLTVRRSWGRDLTVEAS
jgi:hypothetical protein